MKKVCLVEDNQDNADLIEDFLADDYDLTWFDDPADLFSYLESPEATPPDIFLMDIGLPGMDGVEVLTKVRQMDEYREIPMIALTAHAMSTDRERFKEAGFDGYVTKPIVDDELIVNEIERLTLVSNSSEEN